MKSVYALKMNVNLSIAKIVFKAVPKSYKKAPKVDIKEMLSS